MVSTSLECSAYTPDMPGLSLPRAARKIARECPTIRVRQASRALTRVYDDALRPVGLQMSQFSVLIAIAASTESGATISGLATALVMDRTTLTRNLRPLERAGLLRVTRAHGDARARHVVLTHRGERIIELGYPLWEGALARVRRVLGARKLQLLNAELARVVESAARLAELSASSEPEPPEEREFFWGVGAVPSRPSTRPFAGNPERAVRGISPDPAQYWRKPRGHSWFRCVGLEKR